MKLILGFEIIQVLEIPGRPSYIHYFHLLYLQQGKIKLSVA